MIDRAGEVRKPQVTPIRSEFADDGDMAELVQQFVSELPARASDIAEAIRDARFEQVRRAAHQLKGAGAGYGFPQISEVAGRIERQLIESPTVTNETLEQLLGTVKELTSLCERAVAV